MATGKRFMFPVSGLSACAECCCKNVSPCLQCAHILNGLADGSLPVTITISGGTWLGGGVLSACCASQLTGTFVLSLQNVLWTDASAGPCTCATITKTTLQYFYPVCLSCSGAPCTGPPPGPYGLFRLTAAISCDCLSNTINLGAAWYLNGEFSGGTGGSGVSGSFPLVGNGSGTYDLGPIGTAVGPCTLATANDCTMTIG